ncbi:Co2+/Mg2+ efflux protein ApaG [Sansalvadorimonas sp. 2012CJ34-2]|uniref:Protein ApaG n=1 Tax=Parendozoicomonas callyspongiae TaxID=2942213 RepID=A0ABT0PK91_9GAMM|nr:Co2+/Mg2+ efflux protein ApaG [Sansalvadorimonas sp. 2012CJ34-2]
MDNQHRVEVRVKTEFLPSQSDPKKGNYAFAYHITIFNRCDDGVRLLSRHWFITNGNKHQQEVQGDGVIGQQPHILPGESYSYSSGCLLETPVGCMEGSYLMETDQGRLFHAEIPMFSLRVPSAVN